jgi:serine/threonine protein kinase
MVDVFSLGNIIFCIVVGRFPFDDRDIDEKIARKRIKNGKLPALKKEYRESDNSMDMALLKAMDMCFTYRWQDRARASEVRTVLLDELRNANENRHKAIHV